MIDSTALRSAPTAPVRPVTKPPKPMSRSKASLSTKIHLACDALGYPVGFIPTEANVSDFDQCKPLL